MTTEHPTDAASPAMPTEAQARKLAVARDNLTRAGLLSRGGHEWQASIVMLRALARRGWIEPNDETQPRYGMLTDPGRRALARYEVQRQCGCLLNPLGHARTDCPRNAPVGA